MGLVPVDIPADVQIKATIQTGSVYYFLEDSFPSKEPHYFIVLNVNPLNDEVILLVCASTQIETVRSRSLNCPKETLVEISPSQYAGFSRHSIINCNNVFQKGMSELANKLSEGKLKLKPEMDLCLVNKLVEGALYSNEVERWKKRKLSTDYEG